MCRFDVDKITNSARVSINLNPEFRNKRLSPVLLENAMKIFLSEVDVVLIAAIKKVNISSIKCFIAVGFVYERDDAEYNYYRYPLNNASMWSK